LSHDGYEIEHPYVYEVPGMGFQVRKVVTRGWPACIFCSAKNELNWPGWPEIQSRFSITSPNMVPQKYLDGNRLIAQRMGLPSLIQQSLIVSNSQVELAKECVSYILQQIKQLFEKRTDTSNTSAVWIPYSPILGEVLPADKGADNRMTTRIFSFLTIITLARSHLRNRLEYGEEDLVIANLEDFHEVLHITQNLSGIPPYKLKIYKQVFLEKYKTKQIPDKSPDDSKQERTIGVTTKELCDYYKEKTGKTITTNNMKESYINEYINNGLTDEEDSIVDRRQKIYYPLIDLQDAEDFDKADRRESTEKIKKISNSDRMDNILQHPKLLLPRECAIIPNTWLEFEIFDLLKYPSKLNKFELYNENSERVCICKFVKEYEKESRLNGYFSKPVLRNYSSKIFGSISLLSKAEYEKCKKLSNENEMDNVISDNTDAIRVNGKVGTRLSLRHSSAAHVLTNNDLEDRDTSGSSIDKNGGRSL
jgi:hypothetical protein